MGKLVAIVGNSGVGKTSLAHLLGDAKGAAGAFAVGMEQHAERPFQRRFADDLQRYALANQFDYLLLRAEQELAIRRGAATGLVDGGLDEDYFVFTRHFARRGYLPADEAALCERFYALLRATMPPPDLMIYLTAPLDVIAERYARRGRPLEIAARSDLAELQALLDDWIDGVTTPLVRIDAGADDPALAAVLPVALAAIEALG